MSLHQGISGFPWLTGAIHCYPGPFIDILGWIPEGNDGVRCKAEVIQAAGYSPLLMELLPAQARETDREETGHYTTLYITAYSLPVHSITLHYMQSSITPKFPHRPHQQPSQDPPLRITQQTSMLNSTTLHMYHLKHTLLHTHMAVLQYLNLHRHIIAMHCELTNILHSSQNYGLGGGCPTFRHGRKSTHVGPIC